MARFADSSKTSTQLLADVNHHAAPVPPQTIRNIITSGAAGLDTTATAAELNILDGATVTTAEVNVLDGATAGTVVASKATVVDSNKDLGDFRNLDAVNIDAGASGTAGSVDVFPTTASKGKLTLACTDQTGDTAVTINANAMGQATTVNIPDPGAAASYVAQSTAALTLAEVDTLDGITATTAELNNAADVSARVEELTVTGAVTAGVQSVELNHATVVIAATIADASNHQGLFIVKDTSASGTAAHTLTLTAGTFNGTNNVATLNAPNEALVVYFDSAGNGTVVENVGSVALS